MSLFTCLYLFSYTFEENMIVHVILSYVEKCNTNILICISFK